MTKQIKDYSELKYDIGNLRLHHLSGDGLLPIEIDYLFKHIDELTEQNKELQERNSQLSEYRFKHPETGDEKLVMIDRQFIVDRLIDEIYERIECNCTAFAEDYDFCDCNEYFEQFELVELNKESK